MLDIGVQELLVIMVIALLVFGPDKLPELGRRLGRAMREFRRASDEFRTTIETNLHIHEDPPQTPSATETAPADAGVTATASSGDAGLDGSSGAGPLPEPLAVGASPSLDGGLASGADGAAEAVEPFWMRRGGRLLHRRACDWASRVPEAERVALKAATDGWDQGLLPCPVCDPREAVVPS